MGKGSVSRRCGWGPMSEVYDGSVPEVGKKCVLPLETIRDIHAAGNDGGRAHCAMCNRSFEMTYMRYCIIGFMHTDHVCADCKKRHGLQEVR